MEPTKKRVANISTTLTIMEKIQATRAYVLMLLILSLTVSYLIFYQKPILPILYLKFLPFS